MTNNVDELSFRYFNEADYEPLMRFIIDNFISTEPLAVAIGFRESDAWTITAKTVKEALPDGYSCGYFNSNNEIVAIRISQIINRPTEVDKPDKEVEQCHNFTEAARKIALVLGSLEEQIWHKLDPSIHRLITVHVLCTNPAYRRKGLSYKLMTIDIEKQKAAGIQGLFTEATASNSQKLFEKMGCTVLATIEYSSAKDETGKPLVDGEVYGTKCAQLCYQHY